MKKSNHIHTFAKVFSCLSLVGALSLVLPNQASAQNELVNPDMATGDFTGWTVYSAETWNYAIADTQAAAHSGGGPNVAYPAGAEYSFWVYGDYQGTDEFDGMYQDIKTVTAGDVFTAGAWAFSYSGDYCFQLNGANQNEAWAEVTFRDANNNILALYRSADIFPANAWTYLPVTNQFNPTTYQIIATPSQLVAPAGTADVRFQIVFNQIQYTGGSSFWDDFSLNFVSGPIPPTMSAPPLNEQTLCTNTAFDVTATASAGNTISSFQVISTTSPLGGVTTTVTNTYTANSAIVSGIGTGSATINYPLTTNLNYVLSVSATDNTGTEALTGATFDTLTPSLVIEATDFNFNGGQFFDTPANGGLYLYEGVLGEEGVDEHKNCSNPATSVAYRSSSDEVVIQDAGSDTFNPQKNVVSGDPLLVVDYSCSDDWFDYTRTYGSGGSAPAGTYNVWLCMGTSGSGPQASLSLISGDPTSSSQATNFLGNFGTANFSENNWAGYEYVPLSDGFGNLVAVTIPSGPQTLRVTQIANPNLAYIMLMPVTQRITPALIYSYPDGLHPFEATNYLTFTIGPASGAAIASTGIHLDVNGVDVTSTAGFSLTQSGDDWIVNYAIVSNAVYTATLNVTNTAGLVSSFPDSFDTFNINNYQWEAVDYDFSTNNGSEWISGLFVNNPVPSCDAGGTPQSGELATNSYFAYPTGFTPGNDPQGLGAVAQQGIDINFPNDGQSTSSEYYRADGVGSQPASDYVRPKFLAAQAEFSDPLIGPINIGYYGPGYWLNYTRDYPTNNYYIWGRLASGGPYKGCALSIVTSGYGTANQVTNVLGTFSDPNASGYQAWHWIPLLDANGNKVVVPLGGQATLKVTSVGLNTEFFMLVQAPPQFRVSASIAAGQFNLQFPTEIGYTYTVLFTSSLTLPNWAPVGSPHAGNGTTITVPESLSGTQGYYTVSAH